MADKKGTKGFELKISKAQQTTLLEVLIAAMLVGFAVVFSVWCIKYIIFNSKVITAKDEAIKAYTQTIAATGACAEPKDEDSYTASELNACSPDDTSLDEVPSSLRSQIMTTMSVNANLESVARDNVSECYDTDGKLIDYGKKYEDATNDEDRELYFGMQQVCSALRVIPDALPSALNTEATLASLTQLLNLANIEPETMTPEENYDEEVQYDNEGNEITSESTGYETSVASVTVAQSNSADIYRAFTTIERSIREFDVTTVSLEWTSVGLDLQADISSYYTANSGLNEYTTTVYGSDAEEEE